MRGFPFVVGSDLQKRNGKYEHGQLSGGTTKHTSVPLQILVVFNIRSTSRRRTKHQRFDTFLTRKLVVLEPKHLQVNQRS